MKHRHSSLSDLPPEDVLTALRAARADGISTNFGPYDAEEASRLPRWKRFVRRVGQVVLMVLAVILAGLFLFPMHAHACGL